MNPIENYINVCIIEENILTDVLDYLSDKIFQILGYSVKGIFDYAIHSLSKLKDAIYRYSGELLVYAEKMVVSGGEILVNLPWKHALFLTLVGSSIVIGYKSMKNRHVLRELKKLRRTPLLNDLLTTCDNLKEPSKRDIYKYREYQLKKLECEKNAYQQYKVYLERSLDFQEKVDDPKKYTEIIKNEIKEIEKILTEINSKLILVNT